MALFCSENPSIFFFPTALFFGASATFLVVCIVFDNGDFYIKHRKGSFQTSCAYFYFAVSLLQSSPSATESEQISFSP